MARDSKTIATAPVAGRPANINHVAKRAGVSHMTVVRTFSGTAPVAVKTRAKVFKAASELGYRPNVLARGLRGGRTHTLGIGWNMPGSKGSGDVAHSIARSAKERGYVTYIADHQSDMSLGRDLLADFARRRVDGVVFLVGGVIDEELDTALQQFPAAVAVVRRADPSRIDQVVRSREAAICAVVDHFVKTGRRSPMAAWPGGDASEKVRIFRDRFRFHGIEIAADSMIDFDWNIWRRSIVEAVVHSMDRHYSTGRVPFDAIFCGGDDIAMAMLMWLREKGYQVPGDVAVVGWNNSNASMCAVPSLATINPREGEVAEAIDRMLFARLDNIEVPLSREEVPMQFIWRESAG